MMGHHDGESHLGQQGIWTSVYVSGFFFFGISLASLVLFAVQYAAEAGWAVVFKRIMEGMQHIFQLVRYANCVFCWQVHALHHIYHWMDPELYDPASEHYDQLIAHKQPYLNQIFWWIRTLAYLVVYICSCVFLETDLWRKMQ